MNRQHYDQKVEEFLEAAGAVPDPKMIDIYPNNVPLFPQYTLLEERLNSFTNWTGNLLPSTLARAGFVFTQSRDRTYCCTLHKWESNDNPTAAHKPHFPKCKLSGTRSSKFTLEVLNSSIRAAISSSQHVIQNRTQSLVYMDNLKFINLSTQFDLFSLVILAHPSSWQST